jgi:hypothetical protein
MELSIQKWGNGAAMRLPTALSDQLKVVLGDKLAVDLRPEGVMLSRRGTSTPSMIWSCSAIRKRRCPPIWPPGTPWRRSDVKHGEARQV